MATADSPIAKAAPNRPVARACAPLPIAIAMVVGVLVQSALLPMPKNEAQEAFAAGAAPSPAAESAPTAVSARAVIVVLVANMRLI